MTSTEEKESGEEVVLERIKELEQELEKKNIEIQEKDRLLQDSFKQHVHFSSFQKLKELTDEKVEKLNTIIHQGVKVTESHSVNKILYTYLDSAISILDLDKACVFLKKKERARQTLKIIAGRGISPETLIKFRLKIGQGLAGWSFKNNLADLVYDVSRDERFLVRKGHKARRETVIVVPMCINKTSIGVLCAERAIGKGNLFTRNDLDYLIILTNFAAAAIKNARIYQKLQKRLKETFTMLEISEAITSTLNLDRVLDLILANISKIIGIQRCSIMLLDKQKKQLRIRAARGFKKVERSRVIPIGEGLAGRVAKSGEPLLIKDIERHPLFKKSKTEGYNSKSLLSVPIRYKEEIIGVLNITNQKAEKAFTAADQKLVSYYADQVSIAIENANLYTTVEKMATIDSLTGLANHRYFQDLFADNFAFAKDKKLPLSLIMCDVDNFKGLNDTYGHLMGDTVLRDIGSLMLDALAKTDFLASRYGGEEFAIILPGYNVEAARDLAEKIRKKLEKHTVKELDQEVSVTMSLGISTLTEDIESPQDLIDRADKAMYNVKRTGKNNTRIYGA